MKKKIMSSIMIIFSIIFLISTTAFAAPEMQQEIAGSSKISQEDFLIEAQGTDEYLSASMSDWYDTLPIYTEKVQAISKNAQMVKNKDFSDVEQISREVAGIQVARVAASDGEAMFKYWKGASLSQAIAVYKASDDIWIYIRCN